MLQRARRSHHLFSLIPPPLVIGPLRQQSSGRSIDWSPGKSAHEGRHKAAASLQDLHTIACIKKPRRISVLASPLPPVLEKTNNDDSSTPSFVEMTLGSVASAPVWACPTPTDRRHNFSTRRFRRRPVFHHRTQTSGCSGLLLPFLDP